MPFTSCHNYPILDAPQIGAKITNPDMKRIPVWLWHGVNCTIAYVSFWNLNLGPNLNHKHFRIGFIFDDEYVPVHVTMLLWCATAELVPFSFGVPSFHIAKKGAQKNDVHYYNQNIKEEKR